MNEFLLALWAALEVFMPIALLTWLLFSVYLVTSRLRAIRTELQVLTRVLEEDRVARRVTELPPLKAVPDA